MSDDDVIHDDPLARIRALQGSEVRARLDRMERVKARFLRLNRDDKLATEFQEVLNELTLRADPKVPEGPGNRREGDPEGLERDGWLWLGSRRQHRAGSLAELGPMRGKEKTDVLSA